MSDEYQAGLLIVMRHGPYEGTLARDALDAALTAGAFEQSVSLLFMDDGTYQLLAEQDTTQTGLKNLATTLPVLPLYDIDNIYVEQHSLERRGLAAEKLILPAEPLDKGQVQRLLQRHSHILSF